MLKVKYKDYDELPIEAYIKIKGILNDGNDEMTQEMEILSVLCDIDYEKMMDLELSELKGITNSCEFLSKTIECKDKVEDIVINGTKYVICKDLKKFTVAQYVDFQNYPKDEEHLAENLSTFIVPKGKKYNEGYDIADTIKDFNKYMSIEDAITYQNFFLKKLVLSTKSTLRYLIPLMKMTVKKTKGEEKEKILTKISQLEAMYGSLS